MSINNRYVILQSIYWAVYAVAFGFVTYYLQGNGISAGTIGLITAGAGVLAAIIQPYLGKITDSGKVSWKQILLILAVLYTVLNVILMVIDSELVKAVIFGFFLAGISCFIPLANGASFYYERHGEYVNFGFARGMGSLCYGIMAYVLGFITVKAGVISVPAAGAISSIILIVILLMMPCRKEAAADREERTGGSIVLKYKGFFIVVVGCTMALSFHAIVGNYMINIMEYAGGNSSHMGTAIAISAVMELPAMFLFSKIVKKISVEKLLVFSAVCFLLKAVVFLFAETVLMVYAAQLLQAVSFAVIIPASVYYAEVSMKPEDKMKGQAYMSLSMTVGSVIGSLCGGYLIQFLGIKAALICGVLFALLGIVLVVIGIRKR